MDVMMQRTDTQLNAELAELRNSYIWQANAAVSQGRDDLARNLGHEYPAEVRKLLEVRRSA